MSKQNLKDKANEMFGMYPQFDKLYLTADEQGFSNETDAEAHAQTLEEKKVFEFEREEEVTENSKVVNLNPETLERDALVGKYTELFGKAPAHNAKVETLQQKITEKEEEILKTSEKVEVVTASDADTKTDNEDVNGDVSNDEEK